MSYDDLEKAPLASEVIEAIQALINKHGDLPIIADDADTGWRLNFGLVYRPNNSSDVREPRFEIKTEYHGDTEGLIIRKQYGVKI